jgi:hypothetical protein
MTWVVVALFMSLILNFVVIRLNWKLLKGGSVLLDRVRKLEGLLEFAHRLLTDAAERPDLAYHVSLQNVMAGVGPFELEGGEDEGEVVAIPIHSNGNKSK